MKKVKFSLYSKEYKTNKMLEELKSHPKVYSRLVDALGILGVFEGKYELKIYEVNKTDNGDEEIKAWITDNNGDVFVFNLKTSTREDMLKITKIDAQETTYDALLAKNFDINDENVNLIKSGKKVDFKFGRLITDSKNFYTMFFGNDTGCQIEGDFDAVLTYYLINALNELEVAPSILEVAYMLDTVVRVNNIHFGYITIVLFKEMNIVSRIEVGEKIASKEKENIIKKEDI